MLVLGTGLYMNIFKERLSVFPLRKQRNGQGFLYGRNSKSHHIALLNILESDINVDERRTDKFIGFHHAGTGIAEGKPNLVLRKRILFAVLALTLIVLVLAVTTTWLVVASK